MPKQINPIAGGKRSDRYTNMADHDVSPRNNDQFHGGAVAPSSVQPYDFRRPDRIAKEQLRAVHLLHENFVRNLASSLSAYLRAYVAVNLLSVEQLSFLEFTQILPRPTSVIVLGLKPYDGTALLEINPTLTFPILEMLLGGNGKGTAKISREVTEIEQSILEGLVRIILNDLRAAWAQVTSIDFSIEAHETVPQMLHFQAPNEAVIAVSLEVRIGELGGMMNIGIPSLVVKMLRQKFDQQWSARKSPPTGEEHARVLKLIQPGILRADARLQGPTIRVRALLELQEGDVLSLDYPVGKRVDLTLNGKTKYQGEIVLAGSARAFQVHQLNSAE